MTVEEGPSWGVAGDGGFSQDVGANFALPSINEAGQVPCSESSAILGHHTEGGALLETNGTNGSSLSTSTLALKHGNPMRFGKLT